MSLAFLPVQPDESSVQQLVLDQFPQWSDLPLTSFTSSGSDHWIYRLGDDKILRLPKNDVAAGNISMHQNCMSKFAGLPLLTPQILGVGRPDHGFPFEWTLVSWIEGEDAYSSSVTDWRVTAETLANFVRELHSVDPSNGITSGKHNAWRGCPLAMLDQWTRQSIVAISDDYDLSAMMAIWDNALSVPTWHGEPKWIHGDIHAANMIVRQGQIVGVIDFGLMGLGDPACDLAIAYSYIPMDSRGRFLERANVDEATRLRGRGWGLYTGVIAYSYYRDKNPVLASIGAHAIEAVLADN